MRCGAIAGASVVPSDYILAITILLLLDLIMTILFLYVPARTGASRQLDEARLTKTFAVSTWVVVIIWATILLYQYTDDGKYLWHSWNY